MDRWSRLLPQYSAFVSLGFRKMTCERLKLILKLRELWLYIFYNLVFNLSYLSHFEPDIKYTSIGLIRHLIIVFFLKRSWLKLVTVGALIWLSILSTSALFWWIFETGGFLRTRALKVWLLVDHGKLIAEIPSLDMANSCQVLSFIIHSLTKGLNCGLANQRCRYKNQIIKKKKKCRRAEDMLWIKWKHYVLDTAQDSLSKEPTLNSLGYDCLYSSFTV